MNMSFGLYEEKIHEDPRIVGPPDVLVEPGEADGWELVPRYTFRWTNISPVSFNRDAGAPTVEPAEPGEGATIGSPANASPFRLYAEEERAAYRDVVDGKTVSITLYRGDSGTYDGYIRDTLRDIYGGDLETVRANHVEVVPRALAIVPAQEGYAPCR